MPPNKTQATEASVENYLSTKAKGQQQEDCRALMALLAAVTQEPARMWGPSIVGFGSYRYTYESGRSGEAALVGFAVRGRELVLYLSCELEEQQALLARLGKHRIGKSCLYFRQLADLDQDALAQLVAHSVAEVKRRYAA
ncbi:MAG TPA: DUF1801 domain-containing protein [Ramlibacter sp.]|jgi:hypothetical protein|nr:DUF1801 domain-containing protein [Ramlibacter sp.]